MASGWHGNRSQVRLHVCVVCAHHVRCAQTIIQLFVKKKNAYIYIYTHIGRNKQMCEIKVCARMRDYDTSIYINCV